MRVGLISHVRPLCVVGESGSGVGLLVVVAVPRVVMRILKGLVGTSGDGLLAISTALGSAAASVVGSAAADGEEPEESSTEGEGSRSPDEAEVGAVERSISAIDSSGTLDGTNNDDGGCGRQAGGGENSYGRDTGNEEGDARSNARAGGEKTDEDLDGKGGKSGNEDDLGPARDGDEGVDGAANLVGDLDGAAGVRVELVDDGGVESAGGPVVLGLGALAIGAVVVGGAEAPEADVVVIRETEVASGDVAAAAARVSSVAGHEVGDVVDDVSGNDVAAVDQGLDGIGTNL